MSDQRYNKPGWFTRNVFNRGVAVATREQVRDRGCSPIAGLLLSACHARNARDALAWPRRSPRQNVGATEHQFWRGGRVLQPANDGLVAMGCGGLDVLVTKNPYPCSCPSHRTEIT